MTQDNIENLFKLLDEYRNWDRDWDKFWDSPDIHFPQPLPAEKFVPELAKRYSVKLIEK